jgi:hypothetical protein
MLIACTPPTGVGQFTNEVEEQLPPPNLLAAIDGPSCVDRPGTYTFSAVVQPYDPTYTFAWVSVDGVGEHALGNDQRVQVRIDKDSDIVQLALRVAGPRGASATAEKTVRMRQEDDQDELPELNLAPLPCD